MTDEAGKSRSQLQGLTEVLIFHAEEGSESKERGDATKQPRVSVVSASQPPSSSLAFEQRRERVAE